MSLKKLCFVLFYLFAGFFQEALAEDFIIYGRGAKTSIVYDPDGPALDSITAYLLQQDIKRITGFQPDVYKDLSKVNGNVIIIGSIHSPIIKNALKRNYSDFKNKLSGKWESYGLTVVKRPAVSIKKALLITGSDARGTAYGVFSISEQIGVSPWYWWADVKPVQKKELKLNIKEYISASPSVKYRGIFLNDEDWGLQPWAAKTFEPETGDIGPKTYSRIFELLLRLKANLIWPAMHPSTKAFFHYKGNPKLAAQYSIIVGTSHAEPMLRNNVDEWTKSLGSFNYISNKDTVYRYWEHRVKESKGIEAVYTLGMRGVHDSGMQGIKSAAEAIPLLETIISDQRGLLKKYINADVTSVPQAFTAYKEVLDIYDKGLKLPEDVTLVWPDDNYGYIHRLNNQEENNRQGGSGVYYHASYWGRPHDYLWLSSTNPALIQTEMMKAYDTGARTLWVLNVGDIKPLEYNMQLFLDMAWNTEPFMERNFSRNHLGNWTKEIFGKADGDQIAEVLWKYYQLAFERRPEFMGWSQTEPTTPTSYSDYNHFYYGDEASRRINDYEVLENAVKKLRNSINADNKDSFYQLVYYPVMGASWMNKKFLYRDKYYWYSRQNRLSAAEYAEKSKSVYDSIRLETDYYNNKLAGGKWKEMMSMQPRNLPVFHPPVIEDLTISPAAAWSIAPEGFTVLDSSLDNGPAAYTLPAFNNITDRKFFIDVFLCDTSSISWTAAKNDWIILSNEKGELKPQTGKKEIRIWAGIDWKKLKDRGAHKGKIEFKGGGQTLIVNVEAFIHDYPAGFKGFFEENGFISIAAENFSRKKQSAQSFWQEVDGLGNPGTALMAMPLDKELLLDEQAIKQNSASLEYDFYTFNESEAIIQILTLPVHPVNNNYKLRYGVSIDGGPVTVLDHQTFGRSNEWKQNVLRNSAVKSFKAGFLEKGRHTLTIYMIDPAVTLQHIRIDMGGLKPAYSTIPQSVQRAAVLME